MAWLQGGAEEVLTQADSTGSTPSQLAIEKGHRLLGLHLAEYRFRQVGGRAGGWVCGEAGGRVRWVRCEAAGEAGVK